MFGSRENKKIFGQICRAEHLLNMRSSVKCTAALCIIALLVYVDVRHRLQNKFQGNSLLETYEETMAAHAQTV